MKFNGVLILSLAFVSGLAQADGLRVASTDDLRNDFIRVKRNVPPVTSVVPAPVVATPAVPAPVVVAAVTPSAPPSRAPAAQAPPPAAAQAPSPVTPAKPSYPACSSKLADVKAMVHDVLATDIFDKVWTEDHPKFGGQSRIKVYAMDPLLVEMFSGDGESLGTTKVTACAQNGKITAHIKMVGLNFGMFAGPALKAQLLVAQNGNSSELIMDISKTANGKVHIADRMTMFEKRIDSTFSAAAAR